MLSDSRIAQVSRSVESGKRLCEVRTAFQNNVQATTVHLTINPPCDSGMQEDLSMYGNQYTYAVSYIKKKIQRTSTPIDSCSCPLKSDFVTKGTAYTCAYAVMQIPSTLIIQHVRPSYWLGMMEIGWGAFTFAQAGMSSYNQLYAFRFLVGFFESSWFPCMLFVMGSWYTKTELGMSFPLSPPLSPRCSSGVCFSFVGCVATNEDPAKRIALFHMASPVGSAASGYLVRKNLQN